jgi:hypothetical protein
MARSVLSPRRRCLESFTASVSVGGQDFDFRLHTRPLSLDSELSATYYWMDSSRFRIARSRRSADPVNFRSCVGHWWAVVQAAGFGSDPVQIRNLILAASFALISGGKALQQVYRDAHVAARATAPEEQSLPDEAQARVRAVVSSQDRARVRKELDDVLGGAEARAGDGRVLRQTFDGLLQTGVELVGNHGHDGLVEFLARFDAWAAKHRKKGGRAWLRLFLNVFAYECKASFYLCYANAWISLIPWLERHRGLDEVSKRLLRFWHMQNQPIEQPDGRVIPDVFCGQVLSLHPLSGFIMKDPALCAVAGRFFASAHYEEALAKGLPEYWELIGAVLTAAHLYRQAADEQANRRGLRRRGGGAVEGVAGVADGAADEALLIKEFADSQMVACPFCDEPVHFARYFPAGEADRFRMEYACRRCDRPVQAFFEHDALVRWLTRPD